MPLSDAQLTRYSRQVLLPDIDMAGQEKLLAAHVLIIGLGGLGSPVAMYLAGAGIGRLSLADFDDVELSNLHRQIAHSSDDIGSNKAHSARATAESINPAIKIDCIDTTIDEQTLLRYLTDERVDVIVDATDNFSSRHAINRVSVANRVALVSGAAIRMEGQISVFDPHQKSSPCYACLYPEIGDNAENCSQSGVIGPAVGVIASLQALETLKLIIGFGTNLVGRLLLFDGKHSEWRTLKLKKDPNCPVCTSKTA